MTDSGYTLTANRSPYDEKIGYQVRRFGIRSLPLPRLYHRYVVCRRNKMSETQKLLFLHIPEYGIFRIMRNYELQAKLRKIHLIINYLFFIIPYLLSLKKKTTLICINNIYV